jgi:long-subunit acyl-CoA synthetase (AMP-forming)
MFIELVYQLRDSGSSLLLTGPEATQKALEAAKIVGIPESRIFSFCDIYEEAAKPQPGKLKPWTSFWAGASEVRSWNWKRITTKEEAQETTAIINYSSGTTGLPKVHVTFPRSCQAETLCDNFDSSSHNQYQAFEYLNSILTFGRE